MRQKESLTDTAYRQLEELLVTLEIAPGSVLSETALAAQLNIGRTPVREALHRLSREGLVLIIPRKGILATELNPAKQLLALEVRRELERLMARVCAIRCIGKERAAFRRIAKGMEKAAEKNDDILFLRYDDEFNQLLKSASHNEYAARALQPLQANMRRFWYLHYKAAADLPLCARLHADIALQIAEGNVKEAGKASDRLLDYTEDFTKQTVGV